MALLVRKRGEFAWDITDRRKASSQTVLKLHYHPRERRFSGMAKRRYSKASPWQKWKAATPEQIEIGRSAIGPEELARCIAASIMMPPAEQITTQFHSSTDGSTWSQVQMSDLDLSASSFL